MASQKPKKYFKFIALLIIISMLIPGLTVFADEGDPDPDRDGSGSTGYLTPKKGPGKLVFTITTPKLQFEQDPEGYDLIRLAGYNNFGVPGEPFLPHKVFNYALPPVVKFGSLTVKIVDIETETLDGSYNIKPAEADMTESGMAAEIAITEAEAHSWVNLLPPGQMRKWKFARLDFNPILFDPESGEITVAREVTVEFNYDMSSNAADAALLADNAMNAEARDLFDNYQSAKSWYQTTVDQAGDLASGGSPSRLVIITTEAISAGSSKIVDFYWHKYANRGLNPILITETHYGGLTGQAPNGTAEKIREWLKVNYVTWGITHVLLIGDPNPASGDVPMKMMWPRNHQSTYKESPTDYFYADLTGNWDYDGDEYYGEWTGDYNGVVGGVDFAAEVYVGRIPVYGADYATLDAILQKIMDYEMEVNPTWRNTALLPMSFGIAPAYDGAPLAEQMMDDYLDAEGYSSWTMYQQGNGACGLDSIYASSQELRGGTGVRDRWAGADYGTVVWWGHGSPTEAVVGYSGCWDGNLMISSYAPALDDDHPAFVFLNSCTNGYPENSANLGYALLKNGAIGTVSATRVSWMNSGVGYGDFDGSTTNSGIAYEFDRRINDYKYPAGLALYNAKGSMTPLSDTRLMNYYDFNLYGDPTTSIADHAPPKVIINEVDVGENYDKVELYNYGSTSVNLTGWNFRAYRTLLGITELTTYTLPSFTLPAGGYVVLHETAGTNTATDLYFNDNIYWFGGNSGSALLFDSEWVGVDFVQWDDDTSHPPSGTGWVGPNPPYPPTDSGVQLGRDPNGVDTNYGSDWCLQKPSQGSENKGCVGDDVGFYVPSQGKWYLKNNQINGWNDFVAFNFGGVTGSLAVAGDWNNDGVDTVGFYVPSQGKWYLKNNQINGWNDYIAFNFTGPSGSIPVAGDWNNDGWDTVGFYVPSQGKWYLKNNHISGWTNYVAFNFAGPSGSQPVAGDWDADGVETVGFYVPSQGKWYLKNNQINGWTDFVTVNFAGVTGSLAVAGDWNSDGEGTIGFYVPSQGKWYLKNNLLNGWFNYVTLNFAGLSGSQPVAGDWE